jgi:hypothetical protein
MKKIILLLIIVAVIIVAYLYWGNFRYVEEGPTTTAIGGIAICWMIILLFWGMYSLIKRFFVGKNKL